MCYFCDWKLWVWSAGTGRDRDRCLPPGCVCVTILSPVSAAPGQTNLPVMLSSFPSPLLTNPQPTLNILCWLPLCDYCDKDLPTPLVNVA